MATPAPAAPAKPEEKSVGFMFDIIVVRIDCPKENFENPQNLSVDVNFKNVDLQITSSRINVVEFRAGRSYEFNEKIDALRDNLKKNSLKLTVKYCDKVIGKCFIHLSALSSDWESSCQSSLDLYLSLRYWKSSS